MRRVGVIMVILLLIAGYLYISNPDKVVINDRGRVKGLMNKGRALVQQDRFWERQLVMANNLYKKDMAPHPVSSAEMQAMYKKLRTDEDSLNSKMKSLYTPEERMAEIFRIRADSIIRAGKWRIMDAQAETLRMEDAHKYKTIIPLIEQRIGQGKK